MQIEQNYLKMYVLTPTVKHKSLAKAETIKQAEIMSPFLISSN